MCIHLQAHASDFKDFCIFNQCKWPSGFHPCVRCHSTQTSQATGDLQVLGAGQACCEAQSVGRGGTRSGAAADRPCRGHWGRVSLGGPG